MPHPIPGRTNERLRLESVAIMPSFTVESIDWQGMRYTAEVRESDATMFAEPCRSFGTKRCALTEPHSAYVHLVMGCAEEFGLVEVIGESEAMRAQSMAMIANGFSV